jgi:uncharacterized protein YndB with AHSA1/START domain
MNQPAVNVKHTFNASPAQVFGAFTQPHLLEKWWCTPGYRCQSMQVNLQPQGAYRFELVPEIENSGPVCIMAGEYQEVCDAEKLVYTWSIQAGDFKETNTTVTVHLKSKDEKTELELTHEGFSSKETYDLHALDWPIVISNLEKILSEKTAAIIY